MAKNATLSNCPCELSLACEKPFLKYNGANHPKILVIGGFPSIQDDKTGKLFSGDGGRKLNRLFRKVGINKEDVGYTNCVSCYPWNGKPNKYHIAACSKVLEKTIKYHSRDLELVILVGALAVKTILMKTGLDKLAGKIHKIGGIYHLPMHDASKKLTEGKKKQEVRDLQKALALVNLKVGEVIDYEVADSKRLKELMPTFEKAKVLTFDCETSSLDMYDSLQFIIGVGICYDTKKRKGCFVPLEHSELHISAEEYKARIELLKEVLLNPVGKQGFNGGFDLAWVCKFMDLNIDEIKYVGDSMHEYHFIKEVARGGTLENLTLEYLTDMAGYDAKVSLLKLEHGVQFSKFPLEEIAQYCVGDTVATARLAEEHFDSQLKREGSWKLYKELLVPAVPIYAEMSMNGLKLDTKYCQRLEKAYAKIVPELKLDCENLIKGNIDISKPQQVVKYCYQTLGLPEQKEIKTNSNGGTYYSLTVDKRAIKKLLALPEVSSDNKVFLRKYADYKKISTMDTRYAQKWSSWIGSDDLVHPNYWLAGTKTGRISTTNPNFAQLSNSEADTSTLTNRFLNKWPIRRMIISRFPNGKILEVDYSQLELRLFAMVSKDKIMTATYRDGLNEGDLHLSAAKIKFPDFESVDKDVQKQYRTKAKVVNFGGAYSLNEEFLNTYLGLKEYVEHTTKVAIAQGYITNKLGRRRRIPNLKLPVPDIETWQMSKEEKSNFYLRLSAIRQACNFTIQSLGHELLMEGLLRVKKKLREGNYRSKLILEIHDALVIDSPEEEAEEVLLMMKAEMESVIEKYDWSNGVPLRADMEIGNNLEDLEKYNP